MGSRPPERPRVAKPPAHLVIIITGGRPSALPPSTHAGMSLSPDGHFLLTNAMDNTLRVWDVRPYSPADRCGAGTRAGAAAR